MFSMAPLLPHLLFSLRAGLPGLNTSGSPQPWILILAWILSEDKSPQFSGILQGDKSNNYPPTSRQPCQAESMSSQCLGHVKFYIKIWNNITSQPYSQNLHCLEERGWGIITAWTFKMRYSGRAQSAEQQPHPGSPKTSVFMGTPWLEVLDIFQTCSLYLYKYVEYFQLILFARKVCWKCFLSTVHIHNLFYGFSYFFSPHKRGCVCWAVGALASQLGARPARCSAHSPFQCSCEPCYFWLLSYVSVWIRTLSLIPSLACLYCCSSGARVIQFLGNSYYLSLWILPILPYFRIIFIRVIFHWVDILIQII